MSKAFTKEDAGAGDVALGADFGPPLPAGAKNYMTPRGAARFKDELRELQAAAKKPVDGERRAQFLQGRLAALEIIDPEAETSDRVRFGATVVVTDEEGRARSFAIVGIDETDPARGRVSWLSPVAKALLNARVGDVVTLRTPKSEEELVVERIDYRRID